ncbi:IS3 family transposase [Mesoplasma corruscae]|uniref:IS3 family transposase n=1 Tax=Mesoplasma corruscae TaxID=216874 RepID=UPI000CE59676
MSNLGCFRQCSIQTFFSPLKTKCLEVLEQCTSEEFGKLIDNYINYYNYTKNGFKSKKLPVMIIKIKKSHFTFEMTYIL